MKRKATMVERVALFVVWPVIAPVLLLCAAFALIAAWPAILFYAEIDIR